MSPSCVAGSRFLRMLVFVLVATLVAPPAVFAVDTEAEIQTQSQGMQQRELLEIVPVAGPIDPDTYVCGVGDVFAVHVWGQVELSELVVINVEGEMFIPTIGTVGRLAGKTLREAVRDVLAESGRGC